MFAPPPSTLSNALVLLPIHEAASARLRNQASAGRATRLEPIRRWREENPELFEKRRVEGMRQSPKVRANLMRLHREHKAQWRASALKNPKLRATNSHIAAKEWTLHSPTGQVHHFRNLKKWLRDNPGLFEADDVQWKEVPGRPSQSWCRAFHALSRLRPTCSKLLPEWKGWTWAHQA